MVPLKKWNFLASLAVIGSEEGLHRMQLPTDDVTERRTAQSEATDNIFSFSR